MGGILALSSAPQLLSTLYPHNLHRSSNFTQMCDYLFMNPHTVFVRGHVTIDIQTSIVVAQTEHCTPSDLDTNNPICLGKTIKI